MESFIVIVILIVIVYIYGAIDKKYNEKFLIKEEELKQKIELIGKMFEEKEQNLIKAFEHKSLEIEEEYRQKVEFQAKMFEEKIKAFPWVANYYANIVQDIENIIVEKLTQKKRPAFAAAEEIRLATKRAVADEKEAKIYKGIIFIQYSLMKTQ